MLKGLSNTYRNNCEDREITYNEYIVLNNTQIPVRAKLNDDCYENGNFIGSFILKTIQFETSNEYNFRNREFEYYKVVNGESIKLGTFITTEITDNDTTEIVKVTGMDYGLKTQVQYASGLDYSSGNITLMDVWNEACELSGLESGVKEFTNSNFIVDSDQFTGTGAMIRDVFKGIALSSGSFIKVMNDDKIYPIFKTHTEDLLEASINTIETLENVQEIDKISEIQGNTYQQTYTGKNLCGIPDQTFTHCGVQVTIKNGEITLNGTSTSTGTKQLTPIKTTTLNGTYVTNYIYVSGTSSTSVGATGNFNLRNANGGAVISGTQLALYTNNSKAQFTISSDTSIIFGIYIQTIGVTYNNLKFKPQLIKGTSEDYNYEPYVGGTPSPNPDYPQAINNVTGRQTIDVVGKNLFDKSVTPSSQNGTTTTELDTGIRAKVTATGQNKYTAINLKNPSNLLGKTLTISATITPSGTNNALIRVYWLNGNTLTGLISNTISTTGSYTFTIPSSFPTNKNGIALVFSSNASSGTSQVGDYVDYTNVQLETGSTATTYEKYIGQSYELNLGKNLFDKQEIIDNETYLSKANVDELLANNSGISWKSTGTDSYISLPATITGGYGMYIKVNENTQYTLSFNSNYELTNYIHYIKGDYTFISRNNSLGHNSNVSFTTPANCKYIFIRFGVVNQSGNTVNITNIQIEKGSTATTYSPYFTPIELNKIGNYQDSIKKSTGKNLFDKNNITDGKRFGSDGAEIDDALSFISDYIKVQPNTSYTANYTIDWSTRIVQYDSSKNIIDVNTSLSTFTTLSNSEYIRITRRITDKDTTMINEGTTALPYEPYLPIGTWYIEKKIGKIVLDGSEDETWTINSGGTPNYTYRYNIDKQITAGPVISNYYPYNGVVDATNTTQGIFLLNITSTKDQVRIRYGNEQTISDFKTWLSTHNTEVLYVLLSPTYITITNAELINQLESISLLKGLNNITVSSGDLTGTYKIEYWNDNSEIIEDYTDLEDKRDTQPISCVRIGMSNIDGENVDLIDEDLVTKYGENWLIINDNPFAYNQSKREQLITAIFNKVKGFGYSAFVSKTSFKPYLTCGDTVKFKNKNGDLVDSILLRYSHEYKENDMQIQLEAPSETSATVNYIYPLSAIDLNKKTQIEVDKENVKITSLTEQTIAMQNNLNNNYYTIEQANQLIQESSTGLTNTFSEAGGNNIFRNTGLWFEQSDQNNPYEFWYGIVLKKSNDKASNNSALLLQNNTLYQQEEVPNGNYTVSFKYKKLIQLASVKCVINDTEYTLSETTDTEFIQTIEVNNQHIKVQFISDTDNACEIYDLMVNAGSVKLAYSQNQNETTTDTVNISKGITITSSDNENIVFKANYDGVRIYEKSNMTTPKTKFTDKGTETNYLEVKDEAVVVDILIQRVGSQTWLTKI